MSTPTISDSKVELGQLETDVETPALLLNIDTMENNLREFASFAEEEDVNLRPHTKSHKTPDIAHIQNKISGDGGIICQTLSEVEVMAQNGLKDIFLSYIVVDPRKLERLVYLSKKLDEFATTVDSPDNIDPLQESAQKHNETINVLLDVDVGMNRTGVQLGKPAVELAKYVQSQPNLSLRGIHAYEGHIGYIDELSDNDFMETCFETMDGVQELVDSLEDNDIPIEEVKVGSTLTSRYSGRHPVVTEINPGMYAFNDVRVVELSPDVVKNDCAISVLSTVISKPTENRVVVDAGSKSMDFAYGPMPAPEARDDVEYISHSEEHGVVDIRSAGDSIEVGDKLKFIVPHVCGSVNLHDEIIGTRDGRVQETWNVQARGKLK